MEGDGEEDGSQCSQTTHNHQAQHKYDTPPIPLLSYFISTHIQSCTLLSSPISANFYYFSSFLSLFPSFFLSFVFPSSTPLFSRWDSICTFKRGSASTQGLALRADDCLQSFSATLLWRVCYHPSPLPLFSSSPFYISFSQAQNRIFIPRDPKFCQYVIRFLLYGTLRLPSNELKRKEIEQEFEYFSIPLPAAPTSAPAPAAAPLPAPRFFLPRGSLYVPFLASRSFSL